MKKIFLIIAILLIVIVTIIYFNSRTQNAFAPTTEYVQKEVVPSFATSKKVIWYKILMPIQNRGDGYIYLKTEDGGSDSARLNTSQIGAAITILNNQNVEYSDPQKNLVLEHNFTKDTLKNR